MDNAFYGFLPTVIRHDKRVKDFQCRLYSELASLANKYGYSYASNDYLGKVFGKSPEHISRAISEMQTLGYLSVTIEDGYKRRIYVKTDFREIEEVDKNIKGGKQKYQGGLIKISRGVDKNIMLEDDNISMINKDDKFKDIVEQSSMPLLDADEIEEIEQQIYASKATQEKERKTSGKKKESGEEQMAFVKTVVDYLNEKTKQAFKHTTKETIQFVLARQKVDAWTLEDFQVVIDFKFAEWHKDDKMKAYLTPSTHFRAANAEKYLLGAKAWKNAPKTQKPGIVPLFRQEDYKQIDRSKFKF